MANDVKVYRVREHAAPARTDPLKCPRNRTGTSLHRCDECALPGHSAPPRLEELRA